MNLKLVDESFVIQGMHSGNMFSKLFFFHSIGLNMCTFKGTLFSYGMTFIRRLVDNEIDVTFGPPNCIADLNSIPEKCHNTEVKN